MVALLPKSQIQGFNIDTVEKALVFGSLMLRAALVGAENENTEDSNVTINVFASDETTANLSLDVNIPYDAYRYNLSGGLLLDSVREYEVVSSTIGDDVTFASVPTDSGLTIPDYNDAVIDTFEKYLLYYSQILWASITNKRSSIIELTFLGNQEDAQVLISANLPMNLDAWLLGGNYFNALGTVVDSYNTPLTGGGQPPGEEQATRYSLLYESPAFDSANEFHTVTNPGVLERIAIDADYDTEDGIVDTLWYLNGVEIYPEVITDFGTNAYSLKFPTGNESIIVVPGDILSFYLLEEPTPTFMSIETFILHFPAQVP